MILNVAQTGIQSAKRLASVVRREILSLRTLRQIDEAKVHLSREHEASPPFHIYMHLVTPGPDVFAEARDHTMIAALGKVMKQLMSVIGARVERRQARLRSNLQASRRFHGMSATPGIR